MMTRDQYNKAEENLKRVREAIISCVPVDSKVGDMPPELLKAYQLTIALDAALSALVVPWE